MVQRRTARFVLNRGYKQNRYESVSEMMCHLGWPRLETRRTQAKLLTLYKIIHNLIDTQIEIPTSKHCYLTCGHSLKLSQYYTRVNAYKHSFLPSTIKLWNTLPNHVVTQESIDKFQDSLAQYLVY